jgi:murein DD-endopeptidase MepM/ murein hydrolase activator NlpD
MYWAVASIRSWPFGRAAVLALISAGLAACSAESTRFSDNAYGPRNPQPDSTGSVTLAPAVPASHVEARPLQHAAAAPAPAATPAPAASGYVAGGGRGMASYNPEPSPRTSTPSYNPTPTPVAYNPAPIAAPAPEITGSVTAPAPAHKPASEGHWSWDGGTAVTVAPGETVDAIARRHSVPVSVILQANNLSSPNAIQAGQRLVIPRYSNVASLPPAAHAAPAAAKLSAPPPAAAAAPKLSAAPPAAAAAPTTGGTLNAHDTRATNPAAPGVHVVAAGDTLSKVARQYGKTPAEIAKANKIELTAKLNVGDRIVIPGGRVSRLKTEGEETAAVPARPDTKEVATVVTPAPEQPNPVTSIKPAADAAPSLRWPVHGKVIAAFGTKSAGGQTNDGIDVAVPENTPVKAADDGVVAYAGSELKGYGNLVLVRHPSGYVTAYAHAKELLVKKGDPIKRGQVIAKSGQTGNVEAPQLHFEVRKGTAPIDPMQFLGGA